VVELAVFALGCCPAFPAVGLVEYEAVFLALKRCFRCLILFKTIKIFLKKQPGSLLCIVQLGGASGLLPEDVVDILKGLFEHGYLFPLYYYHSKLETLPVLFSKHRCVPRVRGQGFGFRDLQ